MFRMGVVLACLFLGPAWSSAALNAPGDWRLAGEGLSGWAQRDLILYWNPDGCPFVAGTLERVIDGALQVWNSAGTTLRLTRAPQPSSHSVADFMAGQARETPLVLCDSAFGQQQGVEPDRIPALTRLGTRYPIDYGGILLNAQADSNDRVSNFTERELVVILAHEMGHLMGLGHSDRERALMYYSLNGKSEPLLSREDREGLRHLYPPSSSPQLILWGITLSLLLGITGVTHLIRFALRQEGR